MSYTLKPRPHLSLGATLSLVCAAASLVASCSGHAGWGLGLGLASLPLGAMGLISSISPTVRGGWISIGAVILGFIGVVLATIDLIFKIITWPVR